MYILFSTLYRKCNSKLISCSLHHKSRTSTTSLWLKQAYIGGEWLDAASGATFEVRNPADMQVIGCVPDMTAVEAQKAIDVATRAFYATEWKLITARERSQLLKNWHILISQHCAELANIITAECGKPLTESLSEVAYGQSFVEWFAEEARRIDGQLIASSVSNQELLVLREPLGVAALITPWNFPMALVLRKAAAALAAGCTVVVKPDENTPLTCLALAKLSQMACIPAGVFNVITTSGAPAIGELFCRSPLVCGISFTGSTEVGKLLFRESAGLLKRVSLELGGNAPFIVFESADIAEAVKGAMLSKFRNGGQTCVSANRFYIHSAVYEDFLKQLQAQVEALKIGPGYDKSVDIGPLINTAQLKRIEVFMKDALSRHAKVICGGKHLHEIGELFYAPTIITDVDRTARIYREEIFGPVITLAKFDTEDEVVTRANSSRRGLAGYFYSQNLQEVFRVARRLEVGILGVNVGLASQAEAPFGGIKESGIGREGGHYGIDEFTEIKYICLGGLKYE
ncbi:succinate-semialdehyde dehydrogenase [NADP(+)] GabD-like [Bactrocera neohumeralis]|uniref:succinate-semialdehyde dehydrogenase [NADP(+)] GabD-like n=1 Tax=Bactrocera neohumeralis TaxID=98809 RepID=UPI002165D195|nr:succinate-semialdehyde dehydrogenase [NADP(+)] GabD-like [Bactrocera neohumeralis]